jgi:hypothetical protein
MNRKDKTVKQLQAECRKREIGFMMNWTKAALVKRLEDEDKREKWYERQMANKEKEIDNITVKLIQSQDQNISDKRGVENQKKNRLKDHKGMLEEEKINETDIKEKIEKLLSQKVSLSLQWKESINKIKELEAIVKSLI